MPRGVTGWTEGIFKKSVCMGVCVKEPRKRDEIYYKKKRGGD